MIQFSFIWKKQIKSQLKPSITNKVTFEKNLNNNEKLNGQNAIYPIEKAKDTNDFQKKNKNIYINYYLNFIGITGLVFLFIYFFRGHKIQPVFNKDKLVVEKKYPIKKK